MKYKLLSAIVATACVMSMSAGAADVSAAITAKPSTSPVYVDGVKVSVAAYEINNNNYFKIRDIAAVVSGSEKQFDVIWDSAKQAVSLTTDKSYTVVGDELGIVANKTQPAKISTDKMLKDGTAIKYTGYNINNNNYYKLRDVGQSFDFGVKWNSAKQCVEIITTEGYEAEDQTTTPAPDPEQTPEEKPEQKPADKPEWQPSADRPCEVYPTHPDTSKPPFDIYLPDVLPSDGELSYGYQAYLESTGEELVTQTLHFKTFNEFTKEPMGNIELQIWGCAYTEIGNVFVLKTQSDVNGRGSFTISMPKSLYEKTMAGEEQFSMIGKGSNHGTPDTVINGVNYKMHTEYLDKDFLEATAAPIPFPLWAPSFMN